MSWPNCGLVETAVTGALQCRVSVERLTAIFEPTPPKTSETASQALCRAVVRDRWVARPWREPGEEAAPPGATAVARDRVADVARAAVEDPADLEDRDHRLAEGGRVGLDLGLVLALAVLVGIAGGLPRDHLAVAGDAVEPVDGREVVAPAARDEIAHAVDGLQPVGPGRAMDARRRRHRDDDQRKRDRDEKGPLQRDPSPFSASRNG